MDVDLGDEVAYKVAKGIAKRFHVNETDFENLVDQVIMTKDD
jgi:hypothetical protein